MTMKEIPEGMMEVWASGEIKEPIEGVRFSNEGVSLGFSKLVEEDNWGVAQMILNKQVSNLKKIYHEKLKSAITETRNDVIDLLREELSTEYDHKLELSKEEIIKLKKLLTDNGVRY